MLKDTNACSSAECNITSVRNILQRAGTLTDVNMLYYILLLSKHFHYFLLPSELKMFYFWCIIISLNIFCDGTDSTHQWRELRENEKVSLNICCKLDQNHLDWKDSMKWKANSKPILKWYAQ